MANETMLAAVAYRGEQYLKLEEWPVPHPGAGEAVIRVRAASMTRGLLSLWYFTPMLEMLPAVIGHEAAGDVVEVGAGVEGLEVGDRVRLHSALTCGHCRHCTSGTESLCESLGVMGYGLYGQSGRPAYERYHNGGLAEYLLAPAGNLVPLDPRIGYDAGAKVGTLAGSLRAVKSTGAAAGDALAVTAATGASGAAAVKLASLRGLESVVAVSRTQEGLDRMKGVFPEDTLTLAADALDPDWESKGGLDQALMDITRGEGLAGVVDYTPVGAAMTLQSVMALRHGGTAVLVGGNQAPLTFVYGRIMQRQLHVRGSRGVLRRDEDEVCDLLAAGRLELGGMITHRFALEKVNDALRLVFNRESAPLFVVVEP